MPKLLLALLLVFTLTTSHAQEDVFHKEIGWQQGAFNIIKPFFFKDEKSGRHCILVSDTARIKGFLFDSAMQLKEEFEMEGLLNEDVIGGYFYNDIISVFAKEKKGDKMKNAVYNLTAKSFEVKQAPFKLKDDKFIGEASYRNAFLYLTASKRKPEITIYKFSENRLDSLVYNFGNQNLEELLKKDLWKVLSKKGDNFSRSADIAIVHPDKESDLETANSTNKIYLRGDKLLLTIDEVRGETLLCQLNLNDANDIAVKTIVRQPDSVLVSSNKFNSFVIGDLIYYIYADFDGLTLSIHDINTGKELNKIVTKPDEDIAYKNTPIMQEGSLYSSKPRELGKTNQFIRKVVYGRAVITATENMGNHELTIGAFKEVKTNSGAMMMGGMGGAIGGAFYAYASYQMSWNKLTRFKSLFNPGTATHVNGEIGLSAHEKLQNYLEEEDVDKKNIHVFALNGKYYLSSYAEDVGVLTVKEFARDKATGPLN